MSVECKPNLDKRRVDAVVVGGGPAGVHLIDELHQNGGSKFNTLLLEQANRLGGSGSASMQQARTFQDNENLVKMVAKTKNWYDKIGLETGQKLITPLPYLFIAANDKQLSNFANSLENVKGWGHGEGGEILNQEELHRRFPFIDKEVAGGLLYPEAFQLNFETAIQCIIKTTPKATFALETVMSEVQIKNGKVVGVKTSEGNVLTEKVILATGPFAIKISKLFIDELLDEITNVSKIIRVQRRERFSADLNSLPPNLGVFVIAPDGQYVRMTTDETGSGNGDYGFADPSDPSVTDPLIYPSASPGDIFPLTVYNGLGKAISAYGDEYTNGPLAKRPRTGTRISGYYSQTPDDLPIVCGTPIEGLYLNFAHSHAGVMSRGAAERMAKIIEKGDSLENPFKIDRKFEEAGIRL